MERNEIAVDEIVLVPRNFRYQAAQTLNNPIGAKVDIMSTRRALHFVFKIGDRKANARFYRDLLGIQVSLNA